MCSDQYYQNKITFANINNYSFTYIHDNLVQVELLEPMQEISNNLFDAKKHIYGHGHLTRHGHGHGDTPNS